MARYVSKASVTTNTMLTSQIEMVDQWRWLSQLQAVRCYGQDRPQQSTEIQATINHSYASKHARYHCEASYACHGLRRCTTRSHAPDLQQRSRASLEHHLRRRSWLRSHARTHGPWTYPSCYENYRRRRTRTRVDARPRQRPAQKALWQIDLRTRCHH